ncbi:MAG: hypothetical protein ACP5E2_12840 [Terracidiphilus sp.]
MRAQVYGFASPKNRTFFPAAGALLAGILAPRSPRLPGRHWANVMA